MTTIKAMRELAKASKEINNASACHAGAYFYCKKTRTCIYKHMRALKTYLFCIKALTNKLKYTII